MFELADNSQIGAYLKKAIGKKGYPSARQFGKACLEARNLPTDDESLRKMANRLSQILQGNKGIQLEDLPVFTRLLDLSCEELLSAGRCAAITANHLTNYSVAASADRREWEAYVKREDQLILNADEYGKTVIHYALEFQNYGFLKYLMEQGIIWFVGAEGSDSYPSFGAGTSIKSNGFLYRNHNVLCSRMTDQELRRQMILLALRQGDLDMLTRLRAREIPAFYAANCASGMPVECGAYYDPELIAALTEADDGILAYFSTEFEITDRFGKVYPFLFPFLNRLLPELIRRNNGYVQWMLKDAIRHNRRVLDRLTEMLAASVAYSRHFYSNFPRAELVDGEIEKSAMHFWVFRDSDDMVFYYTADRKDGIVSDLVRVQAESDDVQIRRLIGEVNELYDQIRKIRPVL